jgi:hypothetical protein
MLDRRVVLVGAVAASIGGVRANADAPSDEAIHAILQERVGKNRRLSKPNTVVIRRAGYGALGRLDRVRGVRFLRLTRRAADGPAQPEFCSLWLHLMVAASAAKR